MSFSTKVKAFFLKRISSNKSKKLEINDSPKFLILMHQNIGDMIVCSPILREIKYAYPSSNLQVIASQVNKDLVIANPYVDKVHIYENKWNRLIVLLIKLRMYQFDFAVELEAKIISRVILMLKIINPKFVLAVSKREGRYGIGPQEVFPYDFYTDASLNHQRDTCLDILRLINIKINKKEYDVFYSKSHLKKALLFFESFSKEKIFIGLNISGSSDEKKISETDLNKIIVGLRELNDKIVVILIHKPEFRKWVKKFISLNQSSYLFPSYPTESILDVAALVDCIDLLITPDTSLVHLGCAFQKPMVAIYRNDKKAFQAWRPISKNNQVVFSENFDSLRFLDVEEIISKSSTLLASHIDNE